MKTLWKGQTIPRGWFGLILSAVCSAFLFFSCPLSESPDTTPELNGYWFAENVIVTLGPEQGPVDCRGIAIIQSGTIEFLAFLDNGDQIAGMRGTYSKVQGALNIQVTANYDNESNNWNAEDSQDVMPYTLSDTTLTLDINGPNDTPLTIQFTRVGVPGQPSEWVGVWSGTWDGSITASAYLYTDAAFVFNFEGTLGELGQIYLTQTGTWAVFTAFGQIYFLNHLVFMDFGEGPGFVDFYGLCNATLSNNHAEIVTSMGNLELDRE